MDPQLDEKLVPNPVVYSRPFINVATSKLGKFCLSLEPSVLKWHRYLKLYRVTLHSGLNLHKYSSRDVLVSCVVIAFLFICQARYFILMMNKPNSKASLAMGDFISILGEVRNGLLLGFWAGVMQAILARIVFLFYGTRKFLPCLTDWQELSLLVHNQKSMDQLNESVIKLEKRMLALFEFSKLTTEGVAWTIILFQIFLVLSTAGELEDESHRLLVLLWSITVVPHTVLTTSGAVAAVITIVNGVIFTHFKLDLLMTRIEHFRRFQMDNGCRMSDHTARALIEVGRGTLSFLETVDRQSKVVGQLLLIFFYFTGLVASCLSYIIFYANFEANWVRWVLVGPVIQIWLALLLAPLPITHVATRTEMIYRKFLTLQTRLPLPPEAKLYIKKLICITGSARFPLAYYTANGIPYTLQYHGSFILNIFSTIFLIASLLNQ